MSPGERRLFAQIVANQRYVIGVALTQLNPQLRAPYAQVYGSPAYASFKAMEDRILGSAESGAPIPVNPRAWQAASQAFLKDFAAAWTNKEAADLTQGGSELGNRLQLRLILAGGAGLAAVVASIFLMLRFGRRITRELTGLLNAARTLAEDRLPVVVGRLRRGENVDVATDAPPLTLRSRTTEITKIAQAFSTVQRTAVEAAVGQAELRKGVNQVFRSLARRSQSLLHRQLRMLDSMERRTGEPDELADLFRLDHLTTRMRRHAEGLIILSGAAPGRGWRSPVPIVDVLRGAIGEIEDYVRVDLSTDSQDAVAGTAVADVIHLLAEVIENATAFSPPNTRVSVKADRVGTGFVVEIEDRGLGITAGELAAINNRLANPPEFDLADSDRLGLFVVSQLARSHGIKVSLRGSPYGGTTAIVLMPHGIVVPEGEVGTYSGADDHAWALASGVGHAPSPQIATRSTVGDLTTPNDGPRGLMRFGLPQDPPDLEPLVAQAWRSAGLLPPPGSATERVPQERHQSLTPPGQLPAAARALLGLPRRVRQASLAPQLRDGASAEAATLGDGAHDTRTPEEARSVFMSLQRGWRRGRAEAGQPGDGLAGAPDTSSDASSSEAT
jgi:signal transduction histidine kinase